MKRKSLNKKGNWILDNIGKIVLLLIVFGVIIAIVIVPIKERWNNINTLATNFTPIKNDFSATFPFIATNLVMMPTTGGNFPCEIVEDNGNPVVPTELNCPKDSDVMFSSDITYYGTKLRTFNAGILVCQEDDETCCDKINTASAKWNTEQLEIIPNDKTTSSSGGYQFTESGDYRVQPIARCVFDAKIGCKVSGMTQSAKTCNPKEYMIVHVD